MKRLILVFCIVLVLALPVLAVEPLTFDQFTAAQMDEETGLYLYEGRYYDSSGYPVDMGTASNNNAQLENNTSKDDAQIETASDGSESETGETDNASDAADDTLNPDDATLIHQERLTGNSQVNVFAIQTDDETGGAWIQGGSGESLTEKLFGEYTPYNASGIASVDWAWIADVVLFAILVICFFKIVAGVLKRV